MPPLLPLLIENHAAVWSQSLPSKMKDTLAVYKAKGGLCIRPANMQGMAEVRLLECRWRVCECLA